MTTHVAISVSKSSLLHASFAYLSQEVRTLDDIIQKHHYFESSSYPILPTEIMLLIRGWALLTITTQLIKQSLHALENYERSLCELLCADCIAYNLDIYGPDVWQWEQFSGACACTQEGKHEDPHVRTSLGRLGHGRYYSKAPMSAGVLNPRQFTDAEHWLEFYLSRQVALTGLRVGHHGYVELQAISTSVSRVASTVGSKGEIWDVVAFVLREFNCEAISEPQDKLRMYNRIQLGRGHLPTKRDFVQVIPLLQHVTPNNECEHASNGNSTSVRSATRDEDLDWRAQVILRRASHELTLLHDYTDFFSASSSRDSIPVISRRLRWPKVSTSCYNCRDASAFLKRLLDMLASFAAFSVSLPVLLLTMALTLLCFYSKPRSFRII